MIQLYGIPNCDTTKKAISWLTQNKLAFSFNDYKISGVSKSRLEEWIKKVGLESIFNKRSTTWRELSATDQGKAGTTDGAISLMMQHNSIIKRPILEKGSTILVGFNEKEYESIVL